MRIIFFGSDPWFSPPVLEALVQAGHKILLTVTKNNLQNLIRSDLPSVPSSFKGRTLQASTAEDITKRKLQNLIRSDLSKQRSDLSEQTFSKPAFARQLMGYGEARPDAIVLAAFGPPFLPDEVLGWPRHGCLNVHASLLPRWRGASPVFAAIKNGDKKTGVTIMQMTKEVDRGPILGRKKIGILQPGIIRSDLAGRGQTFPEPDNRETLTKKLGILGGELIVETLIKLENEQIKFIYQPDKSPTLYTRRLTKKDGKINWSKSPAEIERLIRAATPWPGGFCGIRYRNKLLGSLKILKAHLDNDKLIIDKVQLPGKNPISWRQFMAGHPSAELI